MCIAYTSSRRVVELCMRFFPSISLSPLLPFFISSSKLVNFVVVVVHKQTKKIQS